MTPEDQSPCDFEALLALMPWARNLAGRLVETPELADDLAQDACVAALEGRSFIAAQRQGESQAKAWLSSVARKLAYKSHRGGAARRAREQQAAKPEALTGTPSDELAQMQMQRRLSEAVLALDEPYRSTMILRFLNELSYAQIAERHSVSQAAVRQRVSRGLSQLRERLESEFGGDRSAMCLALVHFWRGEDAALAVVASGSALQIGGLAMGTKIQLSLSVTVLVAISAWFIQSRSAVVQQHSGLAPEQRSELTAPEPRTAASGPKIREVVAEPRSSIVDSPVDPGTKSLSLLDRVHDLHGQVFDGAGRPIEGAVVLVSRRPARTFSVLDSTYERLEEPFGQVSTDVSGMFKIRLPLGDPFDVSVSKSGYATARLGPKNAGEFFEVRLTGGATLLGRVTTAAHGDPVAHCRLIGLMADDPGTILFDTKTDWEGNYRVDDLQAGAVLIDVRPIAHDSIRHPSLKLPAEGEVVRDFELDTGFTIRGRVVDALTGAPIEGAVVGEGWMFRRTATTDTEGEYVIRGFARAGVPDVHARAAGYASANQRLIAGTQEGIAIDFSLERGWALTGRVVDEAGQPVNGAYVAAVGGGVRKEFLINSEWRGGRSDSEGRFEIESLPANQGFSLFFRANGFAVVVYDVDDPNSASARVDVGTFVLKQGSLVQGDVKDGDGEPLAATTVTLVGTNADRGVRGRSSFKRWSNRVNEREVETDDLGRFRFADVAPGFYSVVVGRTHDVGDSIELEVVQGAGKEGLHLVETGGLAVSGIVQDEEGEPIAGLLVMCSLQEPGVTAQGGIKSGIDGRFELDDLDPGLYRLQTMSLGLSGDGNEFTDTTILDIEAGTKDLRVVVKRAVKTTGRVLWNDGSPAVHASVTLVLEGAGVQASVQTDYEGHFSVGVAPGDIVDIRAEASKDDPAAAWITDEDPPVGFAENVMAGSEGVLIELERAD